MTALWNWLNGLKTIFGLVLLQLASSVPAGQVMIGPLDLHAVFVWLGGILTTVGVVNKIGKATTAPGETR